MFLKLLWFNVGPGEGLEISTIRWFLTLETTFMTSECRLAQGKPLLVLSQKWLIFGP